MPAAARDYDPEINDIADYVANKSIDSELAVSDARETLAGRLPRARRGQTACVFLCSL